MPGSPIMTTALLSGMGAPRNALFINGKALMINGKFIVIGSG